MEQQTATQEWIGRSDLNQALDRGKLAIILDPLQRADSQEFLNTPHFGLPDTRLPSIDSATSLRQKTLLQFSDILVVTWQPLGAKTAGGVSAVLGTILNGADRVIHGHVLHTAQRPLNSLPLDEDQRIHQIRGSRKTGEPLQYGVEICEASFESMYLRACNGCLWSVDHSMIDRDIYLVHPSEEDWQRYWQVQDNFANEAALSAHPDSFIFVNDYQVQGSCSLIREKCRSTKGFDPHIAYFHHTMAPSWEILQELRDGTPEAEESYQNTIKAFESRLGADSIGFHSPSSVSNALDIYEKLGYTVERRAGPDGKEVAWGRVWVPDNFNTETPYRAVMVGAFPISVNRSVFQKHADDPKNIAEAKALLTERFGIDLENETVLVNANRADFTKAIPNRLQAIRLLLERDLDRDGNLVSEPQFIGKVRFVEMLQQSRIGLQTYAEHEQNIISIIFNLNEEYKYEKWYPVAATVEQYIAPKSAGEEGKWVAVEPIVSALHDEETIKLRLSGAGIGVVAASYKHFADGITPTSRADGMCLSVPEFVATGRKDGIILAGANTGAARLFGDTGIGLVDGLDSKSIADFLAERIPLGPKHPVNKDAAEKCEARISSYGAEDWVQSIMNSLQEAVSGRYAEHPTSTPWQTVGLWQNSFTDPRVKWASGGLVIASN